MVWKENPANSIIYMLSKVVAYQPAAWPKPSDLSFERTRGKFDLADGRPMGLPSVPKDIHRL